MGGAFKRKRVMTGKQNKCPECGYHIRGANHEEGFHHKGHRDFTAKAKKTCRIANPMHGVKTNVGNPRDHAPSCTCYQCKRK